MRPEIREKLKRVADGFPPERLASSKERWRRLWRGEPVLDRSPFVLIPSDFSYYDDVLAPREAIHRYLDHFIRRGFVMDDYIPAFFTGCRMGAMPSLFGAPERMSGSDSYAERILNAPEDAFRLPAPEIRPGCAAWEWLEAQRYFLEETEGALPVHVADMQGPLDVCAQLWGYDNVLAAPYEHPEAYDQLMALATDGFLLLWNAQRELLGECFLPTHLYAWDFVPSDNGGTLSADSLVMLSPAFFRRHYRPYLERISDALGGLSVHSCGDFAPVARELCSVRALRGINASQMDARMLIEAGASRDVVFSFQCPYSDARALAGYAREEGVRVSPTITGAWPDDWHGAGRAALAGRIDRLTEWFSR